ncbi:MAG: type IV toxin-antitoxin system AbiEi family antitoxin domain-containing protein, partial [Gemmatimonadaceae bacterium]
AFTLARVKPERLQHLNSVWRGATRVLVSSRERTIVDGAIEPRWVGGFRHLADMFRVYTSEPNANTAALLSELRRFGNGAAAKRVGYLAQVLWPSATDLVEGAHALRSTGVVKLDPAIARRGRKNSRWGLWLNVSVDGMQAATDQRR